MVPLKGPLIRSLSPPPQKKKYIVTGLFHLSIFTLQSILDLLTQVHKRLLALISQKHENLFSKPKENQERCRLNRQCILSIIWAEDISYVVNANLLATVLQQTRCMATRLKIQNERSNPRIDERRIWTPFIHRANVYRHRIAVRQLY